MAASTDMSSGMSGLHKVGDVPWRCGGAGFCLMARLVFCMAASDQVR